MYILPATGGRIIAARESCILYHQPSFCQDFGLLVIGPSRLAGLDPVSFGWGTRRKLRVQTAFDAPLSRSPLRGECPFVWRAPACQSPSAPPPVRRVPWGCRSAALGQGGPGSSEAVGPRNGTGLGRDLVSLWRSSGGSPRRSFVSQSLPAWAPSATRSPRLGCNPLQPRRSSPRGAWASDINPNQGESGQDPSSRQGLGRSDQCHASRATQRTAGGWPSTVSPRGPSRKQVFWTLPKYHRCGTMPSISHSRASELRGSLWSAGSYSIGRT
jgi:hypothetical protein